MKLLGPRTIGILALACALSYAGWLWGGSRGGGSLSDGERTVPRDEALRYATWGEASEAPWGGFFAGIDARAAVSPDGRFVVWSSADPGPHRDLFVAELLGGRPHAASSLANLNTPGDESGPAFGGEWLYFSSDRAGGPGGQDLWRARFVDGVAQAPELVPGPANGAADERDPAVHGERIVFVSTRDGAGHDLYSAPLGPGEVVRLDALCSARDEREAAFSDDGRALYFASDRESGAGGFDLYRVAVFGDELGAVHPLSPLNTAGEERAPLLTSDALSLGFVRTESDGRIRWLESPAVEVFLTPRRAIGWMEWVALAGLLLLALLALLVRRFPELDSWYKCLLISVLAHLLLMVWFRELWLSGDVHEEQRSRAPMQVRLADREPRIVAALEPPIEPALPMLEPLPRTPETPTARPEAAPVPREVTVVPTTGSVAVPAAEELPARAPEPSVAVVLPRASARPLAEPIAEAASSAPAAAMSLPELARESAGAGSAPERLDSRAAAATPAPASGTVARVAPAVAAAPERESSTVQPTPAEARAVSVRDAAPFAEPAADAPELALSALAPGAPSSTTRSMGAPSRPGREASLGSPAARPSANRVASAAQVRESAPARSGSGALPSAGSAARSELPAGETEPGAVAASAAPAAALSLGDLAGTGGGGGDAGAMESGPQRAEAGGGQRAQETRAPSSGSVASRARELAPESGRAAPRADFAPLPPARAGGPAPLFEEAPAGTVAARAGEAPSLALGGLAPSSDARRGEGDEPTSGPGRASIANHASASPRPGFELGESLAARPSAPEVGLSRAPTSSDALAPSRGQPSLALADAPSSVAEPARPSGSGDGRDWLSGLSAGMPPPARAGAREDSAPTRAERNTEQREAAPLAANAPALVRPPEPPRVDQPRRAESDWAATPYQNRSGAEKARAIELYGGSAETERAVARGLEYLASIQAANGAWGDLSVQDDKYGRIAIGKSALCTLAFLGAGHTPSSGTEHSAVVERALAFLLSVQDPASGHFGPASAYDHGIATYAIGECYALTHDEGLRAPLERALAHVLAMQSQQDDPRFRGGWGYYHADGSHWDPWPRTSITAWQVMALESARLSGIDVPDRAFDDVRLFLERADDPRLGAYRYNHDPERLHSPYPTLPASTPAALFALALLGEDVASSEHARSRAYILQRAPDGYRYTGEADFVALARGNPYFWYYGTLAMFRVGGAEWARWNTALQETLLPSQSPDGSWRPIDAYARYARDHAGDKSYTTALCVLSLEVYYRYYLPLLKVR